MSKSKKQKYDIEALWFLFTAILVYYHILHENIFTYITVDESSIYYTLQSLSNQAGLLIDCLLVMSGYSLYQGYLRSPDRTTGEFAAWQFVKLWPVLAVYVVLKMVGGTETAGDAVFDLLLLRSTGLSGLNGDIIWFIAPLFWCSILLYFLVKTLDEEKRILAIAVPVWLCYTVNVNNLNGALGRSIAYGFLSLGLCRVFADLGLGCLIAITGESVREAFPQDPEKVKGAAEAFAEDPSSASLEEKKTAQPPGRKHLRLAAIVSSAAELVLFGFLLWYSILGTSPAKNALLFVFAFAAFFIVMLRGEGVLSWLLNRRIFGTLANYSYCIYVMQQLSFKLLGKSLWLWDDLVQGYPAINLLASTAVCCVVGAVVYCVVQWPVQSLYKSRKSGKALSQQGS